MLNINLVLETCVSISSCFIHEAYVWMKEVTSFDSRAFDVSCRREFEKACLCLLWNHPKSVMHVRSILWLERLATSIPSVFPSTPSHWLICSKKRSSCANPEGPGGICTRLRYPNDGSQPELDSVFIIRLLRGHSCFGQPAHMYVAEPAHVLEPAIVVHIPRISQRHLVDLCCKLSFGHAESGISWHQPDLNLRQIRWLELSQQLHFVPSLQRHCANSPWDAFSVVAVQDHLQKWSCHGSHPFPVISKTHLLRCLQQGSPHHPS